MPETRGERYCGQPHPHEPHDYVLTVLAGAELVGWWDCPGEWSMPMPTDRTGLQKLVELALHHRADIVLSPENLPELRKLVASDSPLEHAQWSPVPPVPFGAKVIVEDDHDGISLRPWGNGHGGGA